MSLFIISLKSLRCNREDDVAGGSEPYIWPVLLWIDDNTLNTPERVGVKAPATGSTLGYWRLIIKDDMRAGETADIPGSVGVLSAPVKDPTGTRHVIVVVQLWEKDKTSDVAMSAGFTVFPGAVRDAVANRLGRLFTAAGDKAQLDKILKEIKEEAGGIVEKAIRDKLSAADILLGLDHDDQIAADYAVFNDTLPHLFNLTFVDNENDYEIQGELQVRPDFIDLCREQGDHVIAAQNRVDDINAKIAALQARLNGASPTQKPGILSQIAHLENKDLSIAEARLDVARGALESCRAGRTTHPPSETR